MSSPRERFARLHADGTFVLPNAWDIGSARILASLGFEAIATTSSGHAASLGRKDQTVTVDELLDHVGALASCVELPVSVDAERCFATTPDGVAETVRRLAHAGPRVSPSRTTPQAPASTRPSGRSSGSQRRPRWHGRRACS